MNKSHTKYVAVAFKISGDWKAKANALQHKFPQLTEADLRYVEGKEHDLLTRVQTRLNKRRDEVVNILMKGQTAKG